MPPTLFLSASFSEILASSEEKLLNYRPKRNQMKLWVPFRTIGDKAKVLRQS